MINQKFIDKNLDLYQKYSISDMLATLLPSTYISMKIDIKNGKVNHTIYGDQKKRKINGMLRLFNDVAKKYPQINTSCLFHLNDWGTQEPIKDYPIFVFTKWYSDNRNIVIPDYLFCYNYNTSIRYKVDDITSYDKLIEKYNKVPFENKNEIAFMRAGTSKNKVLINMFKDVDQTDVQWSKDSFLTYEEIFKHKYSIIHYMRWDTIYMIFKGDFIPFLYKGFNNYLWYDLFLEDGEDYLSFETLIQYNIKRKSIENNVEKQKDIIRSSTEKADKYFTYDYAVEYMGELLLKYQKYIED